MATMNNTTTKNTTTQAQALRWLIDNSVNAPQDVLEAAEKLYTAKTKKYERGAKTETKEQRMNKALFPQIVELIANNPNELINATWIKDHFDNVEVRSPQKARVLADMAIANGDLEKFTYKGRVYYCIPGACPVTEEESE